MEHMTEQTPSTENSALPSPTNTAEQSTLAPTATEQTLATPAPSEPTKKKKYILYIVISLVLVCAGLTGGWWLFGRNDHTTTQPTQTAPTSQQASTTSSSQAVATLQPEDITTKIKTTFGAKYTLVEATTGTKLQSGQVSYSIHTSSPAYKTPGYTFYNSYSGGSTMYLSSYYASGASLPLTTEVAMRSEIVTILADFGLTKTDAYGLTDSLTNVYTGKGLVCTLDDTTTQVSPTTVSCGLISAYKAAAEAVKPFAAVLPDLKATTTLGIPAITDSSVSGYQRATISRSDINEMSGNAELFYRKTGDTWRYFKGTQSELACSDYATTDLRNAFMGESCYDTATNQDSVVK